MTNKDARTPASTQNPTETSEATGAGKSIGWHKAYVEGSRPDLRVPVRQVHLTNGQSVTLYGTLGPYSDPLVDTDVRRGLAPVRENWIVARGDTEEYVGRPVRPEDDGIKHASPREDCATSTRSSPAGRDCRAGPRGEGRHAARVRTQGRDHARDGIRGDPGEHLPRGGPRGDRGGPRGAARQREPPRRPSR
ncbi:hypothetical protein SALBM217S_09344 [Streptomyces griseoloalbus]